MIASILSLFSQNSYCYIPFITFLNAYGMILSLSWQQGTVLVYHHRNDHHFLSLLLNRCLATPYVCQSQTAQKTTDSQRLRFILSVNSYTLGFMRWKIYNCPRSKS